MKKKFLHVLMLSLAVSSVGFVSSCKDTEADIVVQNNQTLEQTIIQWQEALEQAKAEFKTQLSNADFTPQQKQQIIQMFQNGEIPGAKGENGLTPEIRDGYWWIGNDSTGIPATGPQGNPGNPGTIGSKLEINDAGHWVIDGVDTGVEAKGPQGNPGEATISNKLEINSDGNWVIDGVDTGVSALGQKGDKGDAGEKGDKGEATITNKIEINEAGNWVIDGKDTGVSALGQKGDKGDANKITIDTTTKNWVIDGVDTGVSALGLKGDKGDKGEDGVNTVSELINNDEFVNYLNQYIFIDNWQKLLDELKKEQDKDYATKEYVDSALKDIQTCSCNITALQDDIKGIKKSLANLVTGILVQQVYNPVFGSLNLPGVNSNVLIGYYGNTTNDVYFPTTRTSCYADPASPYALTAADAALLGGVVEDNEPIYYGGSTIVSDAADNAGKLYVTVNPNTVDFSGEVLTLVNSQDKASGVKLSALAKSDKELTFGYTRAANNGFYEANAHIAPEDVNSVKVNIEPGLKSAFTDAIKQRTATSVASLAAKLYSQFDGILPAEAVKASYVDGFNATHSVYSNYNVAATAVKPLGFEFGKDFAYQNVPGYGRAMNLINRVKSGLKDKVHVAFNEFSSNTLVSDIENLKINKIEIKDLSKEQLALFAVEIDTTIAIGGMSYHLDLSQDVEVPVKFDEKLTIPVSLDANLDAPVHIQQDVVVDLANANVSTPTVVVTTDVTTKDNKAVLLVPVKDNDNNVIGNAEVPLDQVNVKADAQLGEISIDGQVVAKLDYNDTIHASGTVSGDVSYDLHIDKTVKTTVNIEKWVYFGDYKYKKDANGNIVYKKDGITPELVYVGDGQGDVRTIRIWVKRDMSKAATELWGTVQDQLGNVNNMLGDLQKMVKDANDLIAKVQSYEERIDNAIDSYLDKYVIKYIDKINQKIVDLVNNTNHYLQPMAICKSGSTVTKLSEIRTQPTLAKNKSLTIVPTTMSAEVIAPCVKKHVAVTNVYSSKGDAKSGDATCLNALKAANAAGNMNKVLNGSIKTSVNLDLKPGLTYEVTFSGLDYHGKVSTRRFYIRY